MCIRDRLEAARRVVKERTLPVLNENLTIRYTNLEHDAILMGAAAIAEDYLLENPSTLYRQDAT